MILQREITKRADVRVTVVGDRVFAAAISSQGSPETEVDWRRGGSGDLPYQAITLPDSLSALCVQLVNSLDLRFGAIDLVWDEDGVFWFLEVNPNGQWAWIETRTGHPITAAIVDALERISAR
jgi:glutathione synthase/RimK-type ligase-like ATP-grasp enzyme